MIQEFENFLKNLKNNERYNDYCVDDALSHLNSIKEALDARENNSQEFYKESMDHGKFLWNALPILHMWWECGVFQNEPQSLCHQQES